MPFKNDPLSSSICVKTSLEKVNLFLHLNSTKQMNVDVNTECLSRRSLVSELKNAFHLNDAICKQEIVNLEENLSENCSKYENEFNPSRSC